MEMGIVSLLIGIVLLLFGRKLFWLFVGAAGFLVGMDIANRFFTGPDATKLIIALLVGIIGAFLAVSCINSMISPLSTPVFSLSSYVLNIVFALNLLLGAL